MPYPRDTQCDTDESETGFLPLSRRATLSSLLAFGFGLGTSAGSDAVRAASSPFETEIRKFTASDGEEGDEIGWSVALQDDIAILGARYDDAGGVRDSGSAYVFERIDGAWSGTEVKNLHPLVGRADAFFGWSVALDDGVALVGAPSEWSIDIDPHRSGTAYVFERTNGEWPPNETQVLTASDGEPDDAFGISVAIDGDTALVGALQDNVHGVRGAGSVYVFERTDEGWPTTETQKLTADEAVLTGGFGETVAIDGDTAFVGSSPRVHVFERTDGSWPTSETQLLVLGDEHPEPTSIAVDGDTALVGAGLANPGDTGRAFVYERGADGQWIETAILQSSEPQGDQFFGYSVALVRDTALVAAPTRDVGEGSDNDRGAVFVFERTAAGWPSTETRRLLASDREDNDNVFFGSRESGVSFDGTNALVGAPRYHDETDTRTGAGYLFEINAAPMARDDEAAVNQGASVTVDVLENDSDTDGTLDPSSVTITSDPDHGTTSVDSSTGVVTYTHDGSETTSDEFAYRVTDDDGATSNAATVTIAVNLLPTADFDVSPTIPEVGRTATFDGSDSTDPDGDVVTWRWDFDDDGEFEGREVTATYVFESPGDKPVTLVVTDDDGAEDSVTKMVTVEIFADPIEVPVDGDTVPIGPPRDLDGDGRFEDVDGDGDFDGRDVAALARIVKAHREGTVDLTDAQVDALDFDGDGDLDQKDVAALARILDDS